MTTRRDNSDFFQSPQGAAVLKHQLLKSYLGAFTGKLGSTSGGHVHLIDGYAGPGRYDDGTPGSPALAVETARLLQNTRQLHGAFIESDPSHHAALTKMLSEEDLAGEWIVKHGLAEEHLPDLVRDCGEGPLLAFLDPYGLTVPFDMLVSHVLDRPQAVAGPVGTTLRTTEVIMNFSVSAVRRSAGWATKEDPADSSQASTISTMSDGLNRFLGGDWWEEIWLSERADRMERILHAYCRKLQEASKNSWSWFTIDVSDRYQGAVEYYLVQFTKSPHGVWSFNDAASLGTQALREWTDQQTGALRMDAVGEAFLVDTIADNIDGLLEEDATPFKLGMKVDQVYGETLGEARNMHVRKAIKKLRKAGKLDVDPTGMNSLIDYVARRPAAADTP